MKEERAERYVSIDVSEMESVQTCARHLTVRLPRKRGKLADSGYLSS